MSAARNTGFSSARGEFIIFLDSDDWLSEDIVEKHILTAHKYPEADIYCTNSTTVNSKGELNPINKSNWPESPDTPLELFLLTPPSIACL